MHIKAERPSLLRKRGASALRAGEGARTRAYVPNLSGLITTFLGLLLFTLLSGPANSLAAEQGDHIVNNARFSSAFNTPVAASVTVTVVLRTPATIEFLKYTPGATPVNVGQSAYRTGSDPAAPFTLLPSPVLPGSGATIDLSNPVPLLPASLFHQGEPVFIRTRDLDQNLDRSRAETVFVTISNPESRDIEVIRLTETGPDTGIFTGYIQSAGNNSGQYGGSLYVTSDSNISATYTDIADNNDSATCAALVDPAGIVFNSTTGIPVDGVQVTLIDAGTGEPATVFGDDGVSVFPATVTTGGTESDPSGRIYDFPPGGFRFPFVAPGNYRFQLTLPPGYSAPSTVSDAALQELGTFTIAAGSRLQRFTINPGPAMRIDIPIDPVAGGLLSLQKSAAKDTVSIGDFIPYELSIDNGNNDVPALNVSVNDTLPLGFRYRQGSVRIDGVAVPDPAISPDGRTLLFAIDSIPSGGNRSIRYVAEVTAGARLGTATNRAVALINGHVGSNPATATVQVRSDFLSSKSILMGQVIAGDCGAPDKDALKGVEGVRIFLEDGTFVDTDRRGMFHFEGITPGSHVVQLDLDSLPGDYRVVPCEENTRFSGSSYSQFVDLQGGSMWRSDFHVAHQANAKKATPDIPPAKGAVSDGQKAEITGPAAKPQVMEEKDEPEAEKSTDKQNGIQDKEGILTPLNGFVMAQPIHAVRICLNGQLTPHLLLDGKEIPAERIGFTMKDPASGKVIYTYIGVDFGEKGRHTLELKGSDPFGIARVQEKVEVIRSGEIAAIRFLNTEGNIADARTPVSLQLEVLDAAGEVIPAEVELEIRGGTLKPLKKDGDIQELARNEKLAVDLNAGSVERVFVDDKGIALFQPVNSGGLYTIVIGTGKVTAEGETYVKPKMRDWILVGLGEGSVGYNAVSGHVENLTESGQDEHFYDDERIAFYAKGKVKGEWLLTMAYDSAKGKGEVGNRGLFQTIDPNTYYTLYGDATQQQYDAASNRKVYLKIERDQFYALFGDFDSGLTVTELSRYSRRMNGFKSEWQGKRFEANVFATETDQAYVRDEIQGDGTSGLYQLTRGNIVTNSDGITIETRDRFRSEIIIESRPLSRFTDYSIDYDTGAIYFKEPIHSRDDSFNPVFIVAEYEIAGRDTDALTYGGRIGAKLLDNRVKAGFTYIHEGQVSGNGDSYGVDARWNIVPGTTIKGEFAHTDTRFGNDSRDGNAWLAEIERHSQKLDAKLYYRQQDEGFGLGQQNESETGTRKFGLDAGYKLTDNLSLGGQLYRQYNLSAGNVQDVAEGKATFTAGPYCAWLGGRHANDDMGSAGNRSSNQLIIGGSWLTLNKRLTLRAEHDQSISKNDNADFPTRTTFGADFKLTRNISLFAQQEITSGSSADTNTTTVGVKSTPWEGGTINTSMGRNLSENSDRMFALFGLKQTLKITDKWSVDGGLDRSQTIKESRYYQFNDNVPPASGDGQDFTAVSLGSTYTEKYWSLNSRLEIRSSDAEDKWGIVSTYVGEPREGWGWSARLQLFDTKASNGLNNVNGDLRLGMVYRPLYTRWIILDRLDVLYDRQHGGSDTSFNMDNWRVVNNLNANFKLNNKTQISLQYGAKYVLENIDGDDYSGYTDLIGVEGRYDLTKEWDLGLRGSALHSWKGDQISYSAGLSVGYNVMKNAWVSLGYNLVGFSDKEFSASEYTAQGPFVRFRFKFDQNSVKDAVAWINHL